MGKNIYRYRPYDVHQWEHGRVTKCSGILEMRESWKRDLFKTMYDLEENIYHVANDEKPVSKVARCHPEDNVSSKEGIVIADKRVELALSKEKLNDLDKTLTLLYRIEETLERAKRELQSKIVVLEDYPALKK